MHSIRWLARGVALFLCIFTWGSIAGMTAPGRASAPPLEAALQTTTPQPDGSIIHEVRQGESLWTIAVAYGVYIYDIQRLNKLPFDQDKIITGQKLVIPTHSPTQVTPSATPRPSLSPVVVGATVAFTGNAPVRATLTPAPAPALAAPPPIPITGRDPIQTVQTALVILAIIGVGLIVFGVAAQR